jgi:hypothetical protein
VSVESWARVICQRELRRVVELNDDGSEPRMYDLRVGPRVAPVIAIECVRAMDPVLTELWNAGPKRGALTLRLAGDWTVGLTRRARIKILARLEAALQECERIGISNVHVDWRLKRLQPGLFAEFERLAVSWAGCFRAQGGGKVSFTLESIGGAVDEEGRAVPGWIETFLSAKEQSDVLCKLAQSNAAECHVIVAVGWGGAPWSVESYLTDGLAVLPTEKPKLPDPVTSVWIVSMHATHGIRWDGTKWRRFDARTDSVAA